MSIAVTSETGSDTVQTVTWGTIAPEPSAMGTAITRACGKIAPLWPLKHFVAVNPFLGFSD